MPAVGRCVVALALFGLALASCKKGGATATPESAGADQAIASPEGAEDPLASLQRELDDVDARLQAAGLDSAKDVRKSEAKPTGDGAKEPEPKRTPTKQTKSGDVDEVAPACRSLCDLAATSCDLQTRVCELADEHEGEPRYGEACLRAQDQCRVATEACAACNGAG